MAILSAIGLLNIYTYIDLSHNYDLFIVGPLQQFSYLNQGTVIQRYGSLIQNIKDKLILGGSRSWTFEMSLKGLKPSYSSQIHAKKVHIDHQGLRKSMPALQRNPNQS